MASLTLKLSEATNDASVRPDGDGAVLFVVTIIVNTIA
jgi:hypothetical protein